jgi:lysyl-tRNA synthetase class I
VAIKFLIDDEKALKTLTKGRSVRLESRRKHFCPECDTFTKRAAWVYLEGKKYRVEFRCKCGHIDSETFSAVFESNYDHGLPTLTTKHCIPIRKTKKYATGLFDHLLKDKK